jgi:hypothetical protein
VTGCTKAEYLELSRVEREERLAEAEGRSNNRALSGEDAKKLLMSRAGGVT